MSENVQLSGPDSERYATLKQVIKDGMAVCFIVGAALREIKERKYFLADGYETFEAFCDAEYGWTKRYCNQLIVDAQVINSLPPSMRLLIKSERAARELAQIPETLRPAVVEAATAGGKKPATAVAIKKSAPPPRPGANGSRKKSGPPPRAGSKPKSGPPPRSKAAPKKIMDHTNCEVPVEVLGLWNRTEEAEELITYASSIKSKLKRAQESGDPLFKTMDFTASIAELSQVIENLKEAVPFAVCPTCGGKTPKGCLLCRERGFISEFRWNTAVPQEVKDLRK